MLCLNRLGVHYECDEQMDRQTDRQIELALAIARSYDSR